MLFLSSSSDALARLSVGAKSLVDTLSSCVEASVRVSFGASLGGSGMKSMASFKECSPCGSHMKVAVCAQRCPILDPLITLKMTPGCDFEIQNHAVDLCKELRGSPSSTNPDT
jgi:hypothetical protein